MENKLTASELREAIFDHSRYTPEGWEKLLDICQRMLDMNEKMGADWLKELHAIFDRYFREVFRVLDYMVSH